MAEYILREAAIKRFNFAVLDCLGMEPTIRAGDIIKALESIPAADVVPVGAYNQAAWERDTAIEQLKQIGKSFGEKMDDVRPVVLCRDCKYSYDSVGGWCCSHGICVDCIVREDFFCADGEKEEEQT